MSWKEYDDSNNDISDWLPWGALIHQNVLKNKDDSLLAVFEYKPFPAGNNLPCDILNLPTGWVLWSEKQHFPEFEKFFIAILWCPHISSGKIINLPRNEEFDQYFDTSEETLVNAFIEVIWQINREISKLTYCHWLKNQEIIDFLSDTLTNNSQLPPDAGNCPMYLDALVSQDSGLSFHGNYIDIAKKALIVVSFPSGARREDTLAIYNHFADYNYRHTQRLIIFGDKSEKELKRYTSKWCPNRSSLKDLICKDILAQINGYYSNTFVFLVEKDDVFKVKEYIEYVFSSLQLNKTIEDFNFKDIWWGSLVGIYSANIPNPPITGFTSIKELMISE